MIKVTKLPKAEKALKGLKVPKEKYGNVGELVQVKMVSVGYHLSPNNEPDIPKLNTEIKSETHGSVSAQTVGAMSVCDIINTSFQDSPVRSKIQQQFRVKHNQTFLEITSAKMYDFRHKEIQDSLEYSYESTREIFASYSDKSFIPDYVRGKDAECYWERKKGNSFAFRIPKNTMQKFETIANTSEAFNKLFD